MENETYTAADGTKWVRVWQTTMPGIQQLVWVIVKDEPNDN